MISKDPKPSQFEKYQDFKSKIGSKDAKINNNVQFLELFREAVKQDDTDTFLYLVKEFKRISESGGFQYQNQDIFEKVDSGYNDIYQFGFPTRKAGFSRGGKEGNNAFADDEDIYEEWCMTAEEFLDMNPSYEIFRIVQIEEFMKDYWYDIYKFLYLVVRNANIGLLAAKIRPDGPTFIQDWVDSMKYGLNRYHSCALDDDFQGRINLLGLSKKPNTNRGISPFHFACINPNMTVFKKYFTCIPDFSISDSERRKLMHYAAANESSEILQFMIDKGSPINDKDIRNITPLMIAWELGRVDNVIALLNAQKDLQVDSEDEDYDLLKRQSDLVNTKGPLQNYPIHFAVKSNKLEVVKALVENSDDLEIDVKNKDNFSALSLAWQSGSFEIASYLIDKGASMLEKRRTKKNALIHACKNGHIHIVSLLLQKGIHPDCPDSSGNTPLHYAAAFGHLEIVKFLINYGAKLVIQNEWNTTPAMAAAMKNHYGIMEFIMDKKFENKLLLEHLGRMLCMNFSFETMTQIKYIEKKYKVDFFSMDGSGCNALHYLCKNESSNVFKLGLKYVKDSDLPEKEEKKHTTRNNEDESDQHDSEQDDKEDNSWFDITNMKHVKAHEIGWEIYQDALIQIAEHLLK